MGEIIRFTDDRFLALYKEPAQNPDINRRAWLIFKACEIHEQIKIKEKENANNKKNNKRK